VAEVIPIGRSLLADPTRLRSALQGVGAVLHSAGVNRANDPAVFQENIRLAQDLTGSLDSAGARPVVVFANSIQSGSASPFGQTKQAAADHLAAWGKRTGAPVIDVRLPNLFGEHGRPNYNSVVATFSHQLAQGGEPMIIEDRLLSLLHVQDAVDLMLAFIERPTSGVVTPQARAMKVSEILEKLRSFHDLYVTGELPNIADPFDRSLFNTYRSFCFPHQYPMHPQVRADNRGGLFECVRSRGGESQVFFSTTHPGVTRGNHFHLRKVERFLVLDGSAVIALRRLFGDEIVRFEVSGELPAIIDMPTMWTHSITNTGASELMTLFWTDEVLDLEKPDTYAEPVEVLRATA
jgi:UDP-2-acetamido-2,6-beta-L-arabino-hexul-4-ose reductase